MFVPVVAPIGEVGLSGEIRNVPQIERRLVDDGPVQGHIGRA